MNGIIEYKGYIFWYKVDVVENKIWDFLIEKFSSSEYLISKELSMTDFFIQNKNINIAVEIQSTKIDKKEGNSGVQHSGFEQKIQKQITQNIKNYGSCWFFFDSEYLRYLQNGVQKGTRINLDWFYQFIKEDKLKVFTCDYKGNITETSLDDFKFLGNISMTCELSQEMDFRVLERNKLKIMNNVLKGCGFTDDEIFKFEKDFNKVNGKTYIRWLTRKGCSKREKLYGDIVSNIITLNSINQILDIGNCESKLISTKNKQSSSILGLFKVKGKYRYATSCFDDKFEIAKFFPSYVRNKDGWESLRNNYIDFRTIKKIILKKINIRDVINNKNIKQNKPNLTKFLK